MLEYHSQTYYALLLTLNVTLTLVVMLAACLCCRKKVPNNELLGLEGKVKLKNPDEVLVVTAVGNSESQADLNLSSISNADSEKRTSIAAHRSLPELPIAEHNGDNGSELYETVADKHLADSHPSRDKSPTLSSKQQASVSQHSSISQADDISSPYSRVKNSPHGYAKVRTTEHPYAQLNAPSTSAVLTSNSQTALNNVSNSRSSHLAGISNQNLSEIQQQAEIPAASAIAGIIAASQDLPYMTPPISTQHFSGDSQDSSKGYTSISVREPLANILAQQPNKTEKHRNPQLSRDTNDSHYATVSDDSDETYAAIEDPNGRQAMGGAVNAAAVADIYTSGSETYAQIQPMHSNSFVVSVEINNSSVPTAASSGMNNHSSFEYGTTTITNTTTTATASTSKLSTITNKSTTELTPAPPPVDSLLRTQRHSRQASSSSNHSSMGNLGSPKPEKRQANSPLPPTPKSANASSQQQFLSSSNSNLTSGRNSVISVIEYVGGAGGGVLDSSVASSAVSAATLDDSPNRKTKSLSPSKDIEGMYAKVMKKNKFSTRNASSSQNSSPIMLRKHTNDNEQNICTMFGGSIIPLNAASLEFNEAQHTEKTPMMMTMTTTSRTRSNSYCIKDHGYETIPADTTRLSTGVAMQNRKSDCYTNILQKERQMDGALSKFVNSRTNKHIEPPRFEKSESIYGDEKDYESIAGGPPPQSVSPSHQSDPCYESLLNPDANNSDAETEKKSSDYDPNYEVLRNPNYGNNITSAAALSDDGYAKVLEKCRLISADEEDSIDGYSKVKGITEMEDSSSSGTGGGYSTIGEVLKQAAAAGAAVSSDNNHNYASILEAKGNYAINEMTDHYARIDEQQRTHMVHHSTTTTTTGESNNSLRDDRLSDVRMTRLPELPVTPTLSSSLTSPSLMANSSTTTSSSNMTSTLSSHLMTATTTPSSQYESLTGSDTDPNYESVCYLNASGMRENPYERLQTSDFSDTLQSAPMTPEEEEEQAYRNNSGAGRKIADIEVPSNCEAKVTNFVASSAADHSENVVVDDYFQV